MSYQNNVKALELSSLASSSVTGSYQALNGTGLEEACFLLRLINDSNQDVTVSYDGTTDHEFVPSGQTFQFPIQTNSSPQNQQALMPKGTVVYVKGTAGTGSVYLAGYYQPRL